jgi:uncharacterized membrane protein
VTKTSVNGWRRKKILRKLSVSARIVPWAFWLVFTVAIILVLSLFTPRAFAQDKTELWLYMRPQGSSYEVTAGENNTFYLDVGNSGTTNITGLVFSSTSPEDWMVDFYPGRLNTLVAGHIQTIDVTIRPSSDATKGRYAITLIATADDIRRVTNIEVEIWGISEWLWVGIGVAVVVIAGFVFVFLRVGRRG